MTIAFFHETNEEFLLPFFCAGEGEGHSRVESMVYLMTLYDLIKAGYQVFFVFDCFYCKAPKAREDELKEIVGKSIEMNFQDFMANYLG